MAAMRDDGPNLLETHGWYSLCLPAGVVNVNGSDRTVGEWHPSPSVVLPVQCRFPDPSQGIWILVRKPPRLRPRASCTGSMLVSPHGGGVHEIDLPIRSCLQLGKHFVPDA